MTPATKPVRRLTASLYRRRLLVAEIHPRFLVLREQRRRDRIEIPFETLYEFGMKLRYRQEQAEKKAAKKARIK
jgi:hypothetical protein